MIGESEEQWKDLCEQAANEQDAHKVAALIDDIKRLIAIKQDRLKGNPPEKP
jgi:hypothetical protein